MWKVMLVHPEIMDSEQPTWEILKLIIQAQYQITALGIIVLIAIAAFIIGVNWIGTQRKVKKTTSGLQAKMNSITEELQKTKNEMDIGLLSLKGETARIIFNFFRKDKNWPRASFWAACSVEYFSRAGRTKDVKIIVPYLIYALKHCECIQDQHKRDMLESINYIPDEFKDQREEIRELINKLPVKETKEEI